MVYVACLSQKVCFFAECSLNGSDLIYLKRNTAVFLRSHFFFPTHLSDLVLFTRPTVVLVHGTVPLRFFGGWRLTCQELCIGLYLFLDFGAYWKLYIGLYLLFCDFIISRFCPLCNMQVVTNTQLFFIHIAEIISFYQKGLYKHRGL